MALRRQASASRSHNFGNVFPTPLPGPAGEGAGCEPPSPARGEGQTIPFRSFRRATTLSPGGRGLPDPSARAFGRRAGERGRVRGLAYVSVVPTHPALQDTAQSNLSSHKREWTHFECCKIKHFLPSSPHIQFQNGKTYKKVTPFGYWRDFAFFFTAQVSGRT